MKFTFEGTAEEFRLVFSKPAGAKTVDKKSTFSAQVNLEESHHLPWWEQVSYQPSESFPFADVSPPIPSNLNAPPIPPVTEERLPEMAFRPLEGAKANYWEDLPPIPKDDDPYNQRAPTVLPQIAPAIRDEAWKIFKEFCQTWISGFNDTKADQPDRLQLIKDLGHGRYTIPVLIMAYEIKSLQRLVEKALNEATGNKFDLDFIDQVACNMVQISHMGYPDLAGTYDYSTAWRRNEPKESV